MKNKFLSLAWFKEKLHLESKKEKIEKEKREEEVKVMKDRLFRNIKLINSALTIILEDGTILTKPNATEKDYNDCMIALSVKEIKEIITDHKDVKPVREEEKPEEPLTVEDVEVISKGYEVLLNLPDFTEIDNSIYWGEIMRSMPQQLIEAVCKIVINDGVPLEQVVLDQLEPYTSLKKFWLKCCLNPNAQSAEDLYTFLSYHRFKIDRHGNFYAYRRVKSVHSDPVDKDLMEFVSNSYTKVKAVWKYNPKSFSVVEKEDGSYGIVKEKDLTKTKHKILGKLDVMYLDITNTPGLQYTSAHTGKEDYRIGEVISMPRNEGDDNNHVSCSKGFHAASKKYDYSGFGDVPILMIINPTDVLSVPIGEVGKLRTCRWFFACVLDEKEKFILDEEHFDVTNLGDLFEDKIQENLEADIAKGFAEELHRHSFYVPTISGDDVKKIVKSLGFMKDAIKSRVQKI